MADGKKDLDKAPRSTSDNQILSDGGGLVETALVVHTAEVLCDMPQLESEARRFADQAKSQNTHRAYKADWADFQRWCSARSLDSLPAEPSTIAFYISDLSRTIKTSTIRRRLVAISQAHKAIGVVPPTQHLAVREVLKGILREYGSATAQKSSIGTADLRAMVAQTPDSLLGARDRALLLLGFAAALRRSELVSLTVEDVTFVEEQGFVIRIRRSKTDPEGIGRDVAVPYGKRQETCAVLCLKGWLDQAKLRTGPLFRRLSSSGNVQAAPLSDRAVARIVQRYAAAIGLDVSRYAGHSLRSGFVTAAAALGAAEHDIQQVTGHRSVQVLRQYIRRGSMFQKCPLREMDL